MLFRSIQFVDIFRSIPPSNFFPLNEEITPNLPWKKEKHINLGPRAGNGINNRSIAVDDQLGKVFIGNGAFDKKQESISVIDLDLSVVSGIIDDFPHATVVNGLYIVVDKELGILAAIGDDQHLLIYSLRTLKLLEIIDLGKTSFGQRVVEFFGTITSIAPGRPLFLDPENHKLYISNILPYIAVVDLKSRQLASEIQIGDPTEGQFILVGGMAVDNNDNRLYITDMRNKRILVVDLSDGTRNFNVPLSFVPGEIIKDPIRPFLYLDSTIHGGLDDNDQFIRNKIVRISIEGDSLSINNEIDIEIDDDVIEIRESSISLDILEDKLWAYVGKMVSINLDSFQIEKMIDRIPQVLTFLINPIDGDILALAEDTNQLLRMDKATGELGSVINVGPSLSGIAISEKSNIVYVLHKNLSQLQVIDRKDNIIKNINLTLEDDFTNRLSNDTKIVVDEIFQRLFIIDSYRIITLDLISYEIIEDMDLRSFGDSVLDYSRGVLWLLLSDQLLSIDLITGMQKDVFELGISSQSIEISPNSSIAYLSFRFVDKIALFDFDERKITEFIDLPETIGAFNLAIDHTRQLLYVLGLERDQQNPNVIANAPLFVIDTNTNQILDTVFLPRFAENIILDIERNVGFLYNVRFAALIDLESLEVTDLFNRDISESFFAFNSLTNKLYRANDSEGLTIYSGPTGTEVSPPPTPTQLQALPEDQQVALSWRPVNDNKLLGYHIYRSETDKQVFTQLTEDILSDTFFVDRDLINGKDYSYHVTSIGEGILESAPSDTASVAPIGLVDSRIVLLQRSIFVQPGQIVSIPLSIEAIGFGRKDVILSAMSPDGISVKITPEALLPPQIAEMRIQIVDNMALGDYEVVIQANEDGQIIQRTVVVGVTDRSLGESLLTIDIDQKLVPVGIPLIVTGRLFPGMDTTLELAFHSARRDSTVMVEVETDLDGNYEVEFFPPVFGSWEISAIWEGNENFAGTQSQTLEFESTAAKTRITTAVDFPDTALVGWIGTIKGRIYPNPGQVSLSLIITRPDETEERIDGVLTSEKGFYGHDINMEQLGLWKIQAYWNGNAELIGSISNIATVPVQIDIGKVIIVAGGEDQSRDTFWPTSNELSNLAYRTFQRRRFSKEGVFYLNNRQEQDVDADGFFEDVDRNSTASDMEEAWAWATERISQGEMLYLYLVGIGESEGFRINNDYLLSADELNERIVQFESITGGRVTIIIDASHSGNYVRTLSEAGRTVLTSTGLGRAIYQNGGALSFSQFFLTDIYQGKSLNEAFIHVNNILSHLPAGLGTQEPRLEAEGNLIANQAGDFLITSNLIIGAPLDIVNLTPQLKAVSLASQAITSNVGKRVVTTTSTVTQGEQSSNIRLAKLTAMAGVDLWARVDDPEDNIKLVRAVIIPPGWEEKGITH